jgi:hypothetical protein
VDRLDASTTYQGFFFDPGKFGKVKPKSFDLRHVVLRDSGNHSAYLLWQSGSFPIATQDVTVVRNKNKSFPKLVVRTVKGQASWDGVKEGSASTASPLSGKPGAGYSSPGYGAGGSASAPTGGAADDASTSAQDTSPSADASPSKSSSSSKSSTASTSSTSSKSSSSSDQASTAGSDDRG